MLNCFVQYSKNCEISGSKRETWRYPKHEDPSHWGGKGVGSGGSWLMKRTENKKYVLRFRL